MKYILSILFISILLPGIMQAQEYNKKNQYNLLIGTYTNSGKSEGIYVYSFNENTGKAKFRTVEKGVENPSYLCISENQKFVYAVNELNGEKTPGVSAFRFNAQSGNLDFINKVNSMGADPCYISTDKEGKHVFVANYSGGNLSVFNILSDGSISEAAQTVQFNGNSINKSRQEKSHLHSAVLSPNEKQLFAADLGADKLYSFNIDENAQTEILKPSSQKEVKTIAGSGPRHFVFHPNNKYAYLVNELTAGVTVFSYHDGKLRESQQISMLSADEKRNVGAADIHISPDGKFLYTSNRGEINELSIFSIAKDGRLTFVAHQSSKGKAPRNFAITPKGKYLLAANQNSDEIVVFKRNKRTGLLTETGERIQVGAPVCLKFAGAK
ncbi:MAG: lactonase family protein [Daejeonella sp.]